MDDTEADDDCGEDVTDTDEEVGKKGVVDEGIAVGVEVEGVTVVETMTVDVEAGGIRPPYVHSGPRGILGP